MRKHIPSLKAVTARKDPSGGRLTLGRALFRKGEFEAAHRLYRNLADDLPDHYGVHLALSALMTYHGQPVEAHDLMSDYFRRNPLGAAPKPGLPARPLVLILRGFDRTHAAVGKRSDGGYKPKLRGGHYTTQFLLAKDRIAQQRVTITESGLTPDALPPHDLILNTIAEPDIEGASLRAMHRFLETRPEINIINRPEPVWMTSRDRNWKRLRDMRGVTFPETHRIMLDKAGPDQIAAEIEALGMAGPLIIRKTGTQTGRTTQLVENRADLDAYAATPKTGGFYVIAYRQILWRNEYFRKLRLFYIDGAYYPVVCHLDKIWNVHGGNRKEVMRTDPELMAEEQRFLGDWQSYVGAANVARLEQIAERTRLEFFGIDFTVDEQGDIFIYELNAAMRHSFDHAKNFPYKLPFDLATSEAFANMVVRRANRSSGADQPPKAHP